MAHYLITITLANKRIHQFIYYGDEGRANYLAGVAADELCDTTGSEHDWHVRAVPLVDSEADVLRYLRGY